jgi:membrane-associated protein
MEFIDFLLHFLKDPLTVITQLIDQYNTLIYVILFLVVFVETGFVIMPLLPGDSMLFAIGVIAATTGKLSLVIIIPLLIFAALLGDNLNYFVGHKFGELIKEKKKILFLKREYIEKTEDFFEKNGGKAVIMARFVPIVRTIAPFVAGAGSMKYRVYILNCILGAFIWVVSITLLGYFLGQIDIVKNNFEKVVFGIVVISVLPIFIKIFKSKFIKA